jgi:hypothetical protein
MLTCNYGLNLTTKASNSPLVINGSLPNTVSYAPAVVGKPGAAIPVKGDVGVLPFLWFYSLLVKRVKGELWTRSIGHW